MNLTPLIAVVLLIAVPSLRAASLEDLTWITAGGGITITDCEEAASGELVIPNTIEGLPVTAVGPLAFRGCNILSSITLPDSVTSIGARAFQFCDSLTGVALPPALTQIAAYTFYECSRLDSVVIPEGVTLIGERAFQGCSSLTEVVIPDGVEILGSRAFYRCTGLSTISLPSSLTALGSRVFEECEELDSVVIPENITTLPAYCFYRCGNLTNVTLPTGLATIEERAFQYCEMLPAIVIPEGVVSIGPYAFQSCESIQEVTIPSSIISIGTRAFQYCERLRSIILPASITSIPTYAFYGCLRLSSITFRGAAPSVGEAAFTQVPGGGNAYVLEQFVSTYGGLGNSWQGFTVQALSGFQTVTASIVLGEGTVSGVGPQEVGTPVTLTAIPDPGYAFLSWSGGVRGTSNPVSLQLEEDIEVQVIFISQEAYDGIYDAGRATVINNPDSYGLVSQASYDTVVEERDRRFTKEQIHAMSANHTVGLNQAGNIEIKFNLFRSTDLETFTPFAVDPDSASVVDGRLRLEFTPGIEAAFFRFSLE